MSETRRLELLEKAICRRTEETWARPLEPSLVSWEGKPTAFKLRLPSGVASTGSLHLTFEGGEERSSRLDLARLRIVGEGRLQRRNYYAYVVPADLLTERRGDRLPPGRHLLSVEIGRTAAEAKVISAPSRCWAPEGGNGPAWALFSPTYALRTGRDWGAGDLSDLERLDEWVRSAGGNLVATLPLLATFLDRPFDPSPYRPVSRLFWNEFYLAVDRIPEWGQCREAREVWGTRPFQAKLERLRALHSVDYQGVMRAKRDVLGQLCRCFFQRPLDDRVQAFLQYLRSRPEALAYADFRARVEAAAADWRTWGGSAGPVTVRGAARVAAGAIGRPQSAGAWEALRRLPENERYHLYCQWQMDEQLQSYPGRLLLDIPVGVHPGGFDTWHWPGLFAEDMSMGAPPDAFFAKGQDWECFPIHPGQSREQVHEYFSTYVSWHMRQASYVRIDHVMALHRLFWIPAGEDARNGVYVQYPAEELYALLCLESHQHRTVVIGEDLGTVPPAVRRMMYRHAVLGTWVLQLAAQPEASRPVPPVPGNVVAAVNTHDLVPFAGYLRGDDIAGRLQSGQVDEEEARREHSTRRRLTSGLRRWFADGGSELDLLFAVLAYLARSGAALVLVNVADLLEETRPQNSPGTSGTEGNWRLKLSGSGMALSQAIGELGRRLGTIDRPGP